MNVDLTKGTLANVLVIGIGVLFAFIVIFNASWLPMFTDVGGYLLAFILGFSLLPFLKIRESKEYLNQTYSVIYQVGRLIEKTGVSEAQSKMVARPSYDLFLREIRNGDRIITRVHDLGQQVRFMFAISRLFLIYIILLAIGLILKVVFAFTAPNIAVYIFQFLPPTVLCHLIVPIAIVIFIKLTRVFNERAKGILIRQRNLERMALLNNKDFFNNLGAKIKDNSELAKELFPIVDPIPNTPIQP